MNENIRITIQPDRRYYAELINSKDRSLNGIGQFGVTEFEAVTNLQALLNAVEKQRNTRIVNIGLI